MSAILKQALKPLEKYLDQKDLVEICVNQPGEVWLEKTSGDWVLRKDDGLSLKNLKDIAHLLATYSGQEFSEKYPGLSCHIPEYGYRIQVVSGPTVESGIMFSIRVGTAKLFPLESYMDAATALQMQQWIEKGKNIIVSGGTSSGKTTFINSATRYIPKDCRVVIIEDVKELVQHNKNSVRFIKSKSGSDVAKVSYRDLINWTMRSRPDRIIVGELTTDNTAAFLRLLNTGHAGGMTSLHASSIEQAIDALEMNASLSGELHGDRVRDYALKSLDIIVQLHRQSRSKIEAEVKFFNA
jgi:type IV secretion system protein VirB11